MTVKHPIMCILRVSDATLTEGRPDWYSPSLCVASLNREIEKVHGKFAVFVDGDCSWLELTIDTPRVATPSGNSKSFMVALDWVLQSCSPNTLVYMIEEDYLHWDDALSILQEAFVLTDADYATLYDDPLRYWRPADIEEDLAISKTPLVVGRLAHWMAIESTTMTFAARASTLAADYEIFKAACSAAKPRDRQLWRNLTGSKNRCLRCSIPAWATHVEISSLAPIRAWHALAPKVSSRNAKTLPLIIAITEPAHGFEQAKLLKIIANEEPYTVEHTSNVAEAISLGATHLVIHALEKDWCDDLLACETKVRAVFVHWGEGGNSVRWLGGRDWSIPDVLADSGDVYYHTSGS